MHYSFGERRPPSDPLEAESPHVTFPLYRVMDWFVVTPEGEKVGRGAAGVTGRWTGDDSWAVKMMEHFEGNDRQS